MANRNKCKGDQYERDILAHCLGFGFGEARRTRPGRMEDQGDIHLTHDGRHILQTKDVATPVWREWLRELAMQKYAAGAETAALVVKRRGAGATPPLHLAVMELRHYLELLRLLEAYRTAVRIDGDFQIEETK